jgi:IclR family acetate operon transcriptional repressor
MGEIAMSSGEPYPGTQAVMRAIALLKTFSDEQPELGLAELARLVGLNKTTAYRLLTALESERMVTRNPATDAYRLGPAMITLGGQAVRANDLTSVSQPELAALAGQVGEATTLEILVDNDVLVLLEVPGGHLVSTNQSVGTRWPAHATSTGKVLLAHLPPAGLEAKLQTPLLGLTDRTIIDPVEFRRELESVRQQGYAIADQEIEIGFMAIGAGIRDHNGQIVAAISVNGPTARLTPDRNPEVIEQVQAAAGRISGQLGFRPAA